MSDVKLPDPLKRRHLVEKDLDPKSALEIAEAYMDSERTVEAVDFFAKAKASARLDELREHAIASGDVFLFQSVVRATGETPDRESWSRLAEAADGAGKERYAVLARRQLGRLEE